ncbi:MAG: isoprenyl transferase [Actinomycetota bacterium]|nr:isoprenyl transferase [Actinomycetota bacterium]
MTPEPNSMARFFGTNGAEESLARLDVDAVPRHVAIIMDGNGRWATKRNLPRLAGHRAGAKAIRETIAASIELGIEVLTIYSFSSENWNRSREEVSGLMTLFVEVLSRELDNLQKMNVRVRVAGRLEGLPRATAAAFENCVENTADNTVLTLVVALNYGGRQEIVDAVRALSQDITAGSMSTEQIDEDAISSRLYTAGLPDPDLLIRTSGELRISNFLLWQIAYSEIVVTDTLWPDFNRVSLLESVIEFQSRNRRFGGR